MSASLTVISPVGLVGAFDSCTDGLPARVGGHQFPNCALARRLRLRRAFVAGQVVSLPVLVFASGSEAELQIYVAKPLSGTEKPPSRTAAHTLVEGVATPVAEVSAGARRAAGLGRLTWWRAPALGSGGWPGAAGNQ